MGAVAQRRLAELRPGSIEAVPIYILAFDASNPLQLLVKMYNTYRQYINFSLLGSIR